MRIKSMAKPSMAFAIIAALMLGLLAAPASAEKVKDKDGVEGNGLKDAGTLSGPATVGKLRDGCEHDGTSTVFGSGIGLPHQTKNAYWEIGNPLGVAITSVTGKTGRLKACGRLTKMLSSAGGGLGAACGSSKGWDGKGTVSFPGTTKTTIWLKELGWKASVTTFIVTGTANQDATEHDSKKKDPEDVIVAAIQAQGAGPCATKENNKPNDSEQGARTFQVTGTYTIANGTLPDQSLTPATCKSGVSADPDDPSACLNEPKKTGKSG